MPLPSQLPAGFHWLVRAPERNRPTTDVRSCRPRSIEPGVMPDRKDSFSGQVSLWLRAFSRIDGRGFSINREANWIVLDDAVLGSMLRDFQDLAGSYVRELLCRVAGGPAQPARAVRRTTAGPEFPDTWPGPHSSEARLSAARQPPTHAPNTDPTPRNQARDLVRPPPPPDSRAFGPSHRKYCDMACQPLFGTVSCRLALPEPPHRVYQRIIILQADINDPLESAPLRQLRKSRPGKDRSSPFPLVLIRCQVTRGPPTRQGTCRQGGLLATATPGPACRPAVRMAEGPAHRKPT